MPPLRRLLRSLTQLVRWGEPWDWDARDDDPLLETRTWSEEAWT
jgi:hypothetical protein